MEVRWERLTGPELRALAERDALPVLPIGSLEQHGPHLPVWTDSFIAHAMCIAAAERATDIPAIVLPPLWTGLSEHHLPFSGTITQRCTPCCAAWCAAFTRRDFRGC